MYTSVAVLVKLTVVGAVVTPMVTLKTRLGDEKKSKQATCDDEGMSAMAWQRLASVGTV